MMYVLLIVGFVLLIKGADVFVDGASAVARQLKIPSVVVGLTIVAIGTSLPEAAVSLTASLDGSNALSLGNVIGSNIFNLLMVLGIGAIVFPVVSNDDILKRDMPWTIGATIILALMMMDGQISHLDGAILLVLIAIYLVVVVRSALRNRTPESTEKAMPIWKAFLLIVLGVAAIIIGGNLVVDNASLIAAQFGMSEALIGLTIVAIGTSLPELVTSVMASKKGESGIALGNAVGSCLFNILFIMGFASAISPVKVDPLLRYDVVILAAVSVMLFIMARTGKKINRVEGVVCVALYVAYSAYIILR